MLRQSGPIIDADALIGKPIPAVRQTSMEIVLASKAMLVSLPGGNPDAIRGFSQVNGILAIDECSRVSPELIIAVLPFLAVSRSGVLVALSTPAGKGNWFAQQFHDADNTFKKYRITALQCPRITEDYLAEQRETLTKNAFAAELMAEFVDYEGCVFSEEAIEGMFALAVEEYDYL
jgi:phage FluMu gp28-like protein